MSKLPARTRPNKELTVEQQARRALATSTSLWREANTIFADYVDPAGNKSTGSKGVAMQASARINKWFGPHDEIDYLSTGKVVELYAGLAALVHAGMEKKRLRKDIKKDLWKTIDEHGEAHQKLLERLEMSAA